MAQKKKQNKKAKAPKAPILEAEKPLEEEPSAEEENVLEEEMPLAETADIEEPTEADEPEVCDPYAPYRYRWEVTQKDTYRFNFRRFVISLVAGILALGLAVCGTFAFLHLLKGEEPQPEEEEQTSEIVLKPLAPKDSKDVLSVQEMVEKVKPSVVGIRVEKKDTTTAVASGLIVHADGYIITNQHVVEDAAAITAHISDGRQYSASVIGKDELSDLAVLRIQGAEELVAAELGDSALVRQGDWVIAVGTPGSLEFSASATLGIVSGTDRRVQMKGEGGASKTFTVIQTDASINPGNSGGPLVNVFGQVIGINSMKLSTESYESIGFALPINGVIAITNQIIAEGHVEERPKDDFVVGATYIGANFEYFSALSAQESDLVSGAYVKTVAIDGPAEQAGIRMGDIITTFDGKPVTDLSVITETLAEHKAGDKIAVELYRNRELKSVTVKLAAYDGK